MFRYFYKQSQKGYGTITLLVLFLALIYAMSIGIMIRQGFNYFGDPGTISSYNESYGCEIIDYELTCNDDYYNIESVIIDLREEVDEVAPTVGVIYLTKNGMTTNGQFQTYNELLMSFDYTESDFSYSNAVDIIDEWKGTVIIFAVAIMFVLAILGQFIYNFFRALINMLLVKGFLKDDIAYPDMYKLTLFAVAPLVVINAISRILIGQAPTNVISAYMPIGNGLIKLALDSAIILWFTWLILRSKPVEENIDELDIIE